MDEYLIKNAGYLLNGEGIKYLINHKCSCCPDNNEYLRISPYSENNVSSVSLDICVGRYLWEFKDKDITHYDNKQDNIKDFFNKYTRRFDLVKDFDSRLVIHKDQFFLLEIDEDIKFNRHVGGHVLGKSSTAPSYGSLMPVMILIASRLTQTGRR